MTGEPAQALAGLALDVGSREPVSRDHAARIRIRTPCEQCALLERQTRVADNRAAALPALAGVIGARATLDADVAALSAMGGLAIALIAALLPLRLLVQTPRHPGAAHARRRRRRDTRGFCAARRAWGRTTTRRSRDRRRSRG